MTLFIFLIALGYVVGSFCSAVVVCRLCGLPDPRTEGSKNPGATNVLRLAGKNYAAIVLLFDVLKGMIPVLIAKILGADPFTVACTGLAAVIGHMYPAFFGFKGGKGVATAIGAFLGLSFFAGILAAATWLLVAKLSRYSSLASIVAMILAPLYTLIFTGQQEFAVPLLIMALLIILKHKTNITRLYEGVEPKIKLQSNIMEEVMESDPSVEATGPKVHTTKPPAEPQPATVAEPKVHAATTSTAAPKPAKKPVKKPVKKSTTKASKPAAKKSSKE